MAWRAVATAGLAALALSGCTSTSFFTLDDVTEEAVERISFPVRDEEMDFLRARYIVAGVALYGVHAVDQYSGEYRAADASRILNRTVEIVRLQEEFRDSYFKSANNANFRRVVRRVETLTLVDAAIQPTRRYYRERVLAFLTSPNAVSAVAAARTAFQALRNLAEVEVYRGAMLADARSHAIDIVLTGNTPRASSASKTALETTMASGSVDCKPYRQTSAPAADATVGPKLSAQLDENFGLIRWWDFLDDSLRRAVCADKGLTRPEVGYIRKALTVPDLPRVPGRGSRLPAPDWNKPNELIHWACEELTRQASLKDKDNPCLKLDFLKLS